MLAKKAEAGARIEMLLESADYTESNLRSAHERGHELMLHCDEFIAIPIRSEIENRSSLVLPNMSPNSR